MYLSVFELLMGWLTTIVISGTIDSISISTIIKYIYDSGYKFNIERINELNDEITDDCSEESGYNQSKIETLIPLWNITKSYYFGYQCVQSKDKVITLLLAMNAIERMNKEELEEYNKRPNVIHALRLSFKDEENKNGKVIINEFDKGIRVDYDTEYGIIELIVVYKEYTTGKVELYEIRVNNNFSNCNDIDNYTKLLSSEIVRLYKCLNNKKMYLNEVRNKIRESNIYSDIILEDIICEKNDKDVKKMKLKKIDNVILYDKPVEFAREKFELKKKK